MSDPPPDTMAGRAPHTASANPADAAGTVRAIDSVRQLLIDVRAAAQAEVTLVQAYVGAAAQVSRRVGLWAGVALIAFSIATMAGAVGIIITLARYISPGRATLIVTGVLVAVGLFALWQARDNIRLLRSIANEELADRHGAHLADHQPETHGDDSGDGHDGRPSNGRGDR